MFEIGSSLRAARERQKLELSQVERATRIRARYLRALEDERFDVLPGAAYAKGFLREYAEFLGLDAQRFVDEYNTRFAPTEEPRATPPVRVQRPRRLLGTRLLVLLVVVLLPVAVWRLSSTGGHRRPALHPPPPHTRASTTAPSPVPAAPRKPTTAQIALVAVRGRCWLAVRLGSKSGRHLYERTLEQGESVRFAGSGLWIRLGAPWNVDATLNGKQVRLPASIGNVVVTPEGFQPAGG